MDHHQARAGSLPPLQDPHNGLLDRVLHPRKGSGNLGKVASMRKHYYRVTVEDRLADRVWLRIEQAWSQWGATAKALLALGFGPNPNRVRVTVKQFGAK
jgi:hypothetical protein